MILVLFHKRNVFTEEGQPFLKGLDLQRGVGNKGDLIVFAQYEEQHIFAYGYARLGEFHQKDERLETWQFSSLRLFVARWALSDQVAQAGLSNNTVHLLQHYLPVFEELQQIVEANRLAELITAYEILGDMITFRDIARDDCVTDQCTSIDVLETWRRRADALWINEISYDDLEMSPLEDDNEHYS